MELRDRRHQAMIDTIRTLSMDAVQRANSGHPGAPMGIAPVAWILWDRFMRHNPENPLWPNRDRFVLSAGHASMLLYSLLHLCGYDVTLDDIRDFRQLHGKCAGHPELGLTPGVEMTTGPLGQGLATSVGLAVAEKWLAAHFNRPGFEIVDYRVYAIAGDGCMMEGVSSEAASLAGHLGLDNLVWIYDSNGITIEGSTDLTFGEDVEARFRAYGWAVRHAGDANDLEGVNGALEETGLERGRPSLIIVDSHIAFGSPGKQDSADSHGAPLGEEEVRATKLVYGWDPDRTFHVPDEAREYGALAAERGRALEEAWRLGFSEYEKVHPELARRFRAMQNRELPEGWDAGLPVFPADAKGVATRSASGKVLNAVASGVPWLMGGSADLGPSNKTWIDGSGPFGSDNREGRNFHFGVREHVMGAIANGLALSGLRPYAGTFFVFSDYMRPAIRMSCLMGQPVIYVFTHDSIGVGEDGPTHQPIEHIASLRAIPNLDVIRPADANETAAAWRHAMGLTDRPAALILSRQALPTIDRTQYAPAEGALRGGYVLADPEGAPDVILIGTGSEVWICLEAASRLSEEGIKARVVSMPCWSLFDRQDVAYREEVLPAGLQARVAVEAGVTFGWERYTGGLDRGAVVGIDRFGASAPAVDLRKEYGMTVEHVLEKARKVVAAGRS